MFTVGGSYARLFGLQGTYFCIYIMYVSAFLCLASMATGTCCQHIAWIKYALRFVDFVRGLDYNIDCRMLSYFDDYEGEKMGYLSIRQVSEKWGISGRRIQILCVQGRIPGATKIGSYWAIPEDVEKPKDERVKSGRYIKTIG